MSSDGGSRDGSRYSLVSPARNEDDIVDRTVQSVINQTIPPQKWVILDDGSTDKTGDILDSYSRAHAWIEVIHVEKKVSCYKGAQEMLWMAFDRVDTDVNDFIGKLDIDIELDPTYFEDLMHKFRQDSTLGIAGGTLYHIEKGKRRVEQCPKYHVRGGLKFYRRECFKDIGGMTFALGYDAIDEIRAAMLGWETRSYDDLMGLHHRPTGQQKGVIGLHFYRGKIDYLVGAHPAFSFIKSLRYMAVRPYVLGGIAGMLGFLRCCLGGIQRSVDDPQFIAFLRRKQMNRLLGRGS